MTIAIVPLSGSEKLHFREVFTSAWASRLLPGYIRTYVFVRFSSPHGHREMCPPELNLFWNPAYSCFTFGEVDLVPTLEEYTTLLRCLRIQGNKAYVRATNLLTFVKKLMMITGMSEQWAAARIQQRGDGKCIPWASLRDLILAYPDVKRRVDVLALSIYGLVIFPKAIEHIDEAVADLFDRLGKQNTPVPAILVETFRSLIKLRKGRWKYFRISEKRMLCGKPLGWLLTKSFIIAEALIEYLFLEFGELLVTHNYSS
ncbi:hypothetical protein CXB51_014679 [Gossypium anomalum]|uniref:DUF7745 domain-containing protein n=1 Tax=Gossypium anomalum TaxID=47600 RepID=A0A8J5Z5M3_9ROSI|nr:hypothetical protein CXB51_014679 [Gossypium anomalum]